MKVIRYSKGKHHTYHNFHTLVLNELKVLALGTDTPHMVTLIGGCFRNLETVFIVCELCKGTLSDCLESSTITNTQKLSLCLKVIDLYRFLVFRIKLVHGDIKLANIFYTREGRGDFSLKLGDMGSSHNLHRGDIFYQPTRDTRTEWDPHHPHINNKNNTIHANATCDLFSVMFVLNSIVFSHVDKGCYLHTLYREKKVDTVAAVRDLDGNIHCTAFIELTRYILENSSTPSHLDDFLLHLENCLRSLFGYSVYEVTN